MPRQTAPVKIKSNQYHQIIFAGTDCNFINWRFVVNNQTYNQVWKSALFFFIFYFLAVFAEAVWFIKQSIGTKPTVAFSFCPFARIFFFFTFFVFSLRASAPDLHLSRSFINFSPRRHEFIRSIARFKIKLLYYFWEAILRTPTIIFVVLNSKLALRNRFAGIPFKLIDRARFPLFFPLKKLKRAAAKNIFFSFAL